MLFNSPAFLFAFLPATLIVVGVVIKIGGRNAGMAALLVASICFYSYYGLWALPIVILSIGINYSISRAMLRADLRPRKMLLILGVALNVATLGYFKYFNFFIENINLLGAGIRAEHILLPLAISFYTFQQIAFLVDTYKGLGKHLNLLNYATSVLFFPHLIAGPLIHYDRIVSQFESRFSVNPSNIFVGLPIFFVGLAKKVFLADGIAEITTPMWQKASTGAAIDAVAAWIASLGYMAQLYFDFSGYSDMAIGLGLMFGIALPINFLSPYKSASIIEFWRRWHITLSEFLRDYVYIPLGGSRTGSFNRYRNLLLTMLVGGLWHGAGWTFVIWGMLHGVYLVINHLWRQVPLPRRLHTMIGPVYAIVTFGAVLVGWVFFRAADVATAFAVLKGMSGANGAYAAVETGWLLGLLPSFAGIQFSGGMPMPDMAQVSCLILASYLVIFFMPNTAEIFGLLGDRVPVRPSLRGAVLAGITAGLAAFGVFSAAPSEFLYFKF